MEAPIPQDSAAEAERLAKLLARALHAEGSAEAKVEALEAEADRVSSALDEARAERAQIIRIRSDIQRQYLEALKPVPDELAAYVAGLPFADELPPLPDYTKPAADDCDWIWSDETRPGDAYRAWLAEGHAPTETFTIGVEGARGFVRVGHGWGSLGGDTIGTAARTDRISVRLVGLTPDAEVKLSIGHQWALVERLEVHDLGLRGDSSNFIVGTVLLGIPAGDLVFDGCEFLQGHERSNPHVSGAHLGDHRSLVVRNHRTSPDLRLREHDFYIKSSTAGPTWIVDNVFGAGNRTWFQRRPGANEGNARPAGPFIVMRNRGDGYGWRHGMDGGSFAGGSAITVWTAPEDKVFVAGNVVLDSKYGCLMVGGQPPEKNFLNENGFPIQEVWIWDNVFENSQQGRPGNLPKREAASVTGVELVHWGPNDLQRGARLTLNNEWGMNRHGIANGEVRLYDPAIVGDSVYTWDASLQDERPMLQSELEALLVP